MDYRRIRLLMLSAALSLPCPLAWAQVPNDDLALDQRISASFEKAAAPDILSFLARTKGYEPVLDPTLQDKISFRLEHVTVRTALNALCDSLGCRWRVDGRKLVFEALANPEGKSEQTDSAELLAPLQKIVPPGTRFNNVPLATALQSLARVAGTDVELTVGMVEANHRVSGDVGSKTVQAAIRQLVAATGLKAGSSYSVSISRPGRRPVKVVAVLAATWVVLSAK